MSYIYYGMNTELEGFGHLGALETFRGLSPGRDEVFVLRLQIRGAAFPATTDAMELVRAVGQAFKGTHWYERAMDYDIRGVAMTVLPDESVQADVICTRTNPSALFAPYPFRDATEVVEELSKNERLNSRFPGIRIERAEWLWLAGDDLKDETQHWLHQPLLWDHAVEPHETAAFENAEGVWIGTADKPLYAVPAPAPPGLTAPAQQAQPPGSGPAPPATVPSAPGPPSLPVSRPQAGAQSATAPTQAGVTGTQWLLLGAVATVAWVAYREITKEKRGV